MPARILTAADAPLVREIVAADPVCNVFVGSRVDAGVLSPTSAGVLWGWPAERPRALLHVGANMVPVATDLMAIPAFVEAAGRRRTCQSIVGPSWLAWPLWEALSQRWGTSYQAVREVRRHQPVMSLSGAPVGPTDRRVRPISAADFSSYLQASVAMYTEEVGSDPLAQGAGSGYRNYCRWLVDSGRAFGIVEDAKVIFKSDIGAASGKVAQIQGVWLDPELRGRGLAAPAMAAVVEYVLSEYAIASLYVNDFNLRAIRAYERVGFTTVGEFATVLY